jgi:hypothetical protein
MTIKFRSLIILLCLSLVISNCTKTNVQLNQFQVKVSLFSVLTVDQNPATTLYYDKSTYKINLHGNCHFSINQISISLDQGTTWIDPLAVDCASERYSINLQLNSLDAIKTLLGKSFTMSIRGQSTNTTTEIVNVLVMPEAELLTSPTPDPEKNLVAELDVAPTTFNNNLSFTFNVKGLNVTRFRYGFGLEPLNCGDSNTYIQTDYSVISSLVLLNIPDGKVKLCLLGGDDKGNWQEMLKATEVQWTKDTDLPTVTISSPITNATYGGDTDFSNFVVTGECSYLTDNGEIISINLVDSSGRTRLGNVICSSSAWSIAFDLLSFQLGFIQITASINDRAGNQDTMIKSFIKDLVPSGSILINSGSTITNNSNLNLILTTDNATSMKISSSPDCSSGSWETYSSTKVWSVSAGTGSREVSVLFRNELNTQSPCYSDSIQLDTLPPTSPTEVRTYGGTVTPSRVNTPRFEITGIADTDNLQFYSNSSCSSTIDTGRLEPSSPYVVELNLVSDGTFSLFTIVSDSAGNSSTCNGPHMSFVLDTSAPTVSNVSITSGSLFKAEDSIQIEVQFSEAINVDLSVGTLNLILGIATGGTANFNGMLGIDKIRFNYIVAPGDDTDYLDYLSVNSLVLTNPALINDYVGNLANLSLPLPGAVGSISAIERIIIDTTPPSGFGVLGIGATIDDVDPWQSGKSADKFIFWTGSSGASTYSAFIYQEDLVTLISSQSNLIETKLDISVASLSDGTYGLKIRALDTAGNFVDADGGTNYIFQVDRTAPVLHSLSITEGSVVSTLPVHLDLSSVTEVNTLLSAWVSTFGCDTDGGNFYSYSGILSYSLNEPFKNHAISTRVLDTAGNLSNCLTTIVQHKPDLSIGLSFPSSGSLWNEYLNPINPAEECNEMKLTDCIHASESRKVVIGGLRNCKFFDDLYDNLGVFDWNCELSDTGDAQIVSLGFRSGLGLADLIFWDDIELRFKWNELSLTMVRDGISITTTNTTSWDNNILVDYQFTSPATLSESGKVFIIGHPGQTSTAINSPITLANDKIALLTASGTLFDTFTLQSGNSFSPSSTLVKINPNVKFSWVETKLARGLFSVNVGLNLAGNLNRINRTHLLKFAENGLVVSGTGNYISYVRSAQNANSGIKINSLALHNNIWQSTLFNNGMDGFSVFNNLGPNYFFGVLSFANNSNGIRVSNSERQALGLLTLANNASSGLEISAATYSFINQLTSINNSVFGINVNYSMDNNISEMALISSGTNLGFYNNSNLKMRGQVFISNKGLQSGCKVSSPGIDLNDNCESVNVDLTVYDYTNLNPIFTDGNGKMTGAYEPLLQAFISEGTYSFALLNSSNRWTEFSNQFRGFGKDGLIPFDNTNIGRCNTGDICRIWDWRLALLSPLRDTSVSILSSPAGDAADCPIEAAGDNFIIINDFRLGPEAVVHRNAIELPFGKGNHDGICQNEESCLYTPNLGSDQNQNTGAILKSCNFKTSPTGIQNIRMYYYAEPL